jgi:hypothetical protein
MQKVELTSKLVLAIIGLTAVSAILIPTYAVPSIKSADIVDETIQSVDIKNGQVKTEDLASGAILPKIDRVTADTVISPGQSGGASAECPAGTVLSGGGFLASDPVRVTQNLPVENKWIVDGRHEGTVGDVSLAAYALCIRPAP